MASDEPTHSRTSKASRAAASSSASADGLPRLWRRLQPFAPALLFALGLGVYAGGLWLHRGEAFPQSRWPYFVYYADALLQGQLHFATPPPAQLDLALYEGRLYMHHPPFPAVLLAPFVALFGLGLPDRLLSAVLGAANGVGFYLLLGAVDRRGLVSVPEPARLGLSLFFLFGTVHFYLAVTGNPWELAHVVCNSLVVLALGLALAGRFTLAALVYVAILFTRSHVFLTAPILLGLFAWLEGREGGDRRALLARLAPVALVWAAGLALLLAFNHARFGDPFENGIRYHAMHGAFRERFETYGYFDLAYLPRNLRALLLGLPHLGRDFPWLGLSPTGLSLFLASPLYLFLFRSLRPPHRGQAALLWLGVGLASLPILLLMGTGELQFGHRYSSDLQVFLIGLTWLGMGGRFGALAGALLALSVAVNTWGAVWFVSSYSQ